MKKSNVFTGSSGKGEKMGTRKWVRKKTVRTDGDIARNFVRSNRRLRA